MPATKPPALAPLLLPAIAALESINAAQLTTSIPMALFELAPAVMRVLAVMVTGVPLHPVRATPREVLLPPPLIVLRMITVPVVFPEIAMPIDVPEAPPVIDALSARIVPCAFATRSTAVDE